MGSTDRQPGDLCPFYGDRCLRPTCNRICELDAKKAEQEWPS